AGAEAWRERDCSLAALFIPFDDVLPCDDRLEHQVEHRAQPPDSAHRRVRRQQVVLAAPSFGGGSMGETRVPVKVGVAKLLADRKVDLPSGPAAPEAAIRVAGRQ